MLDFKTQWDDDLPLCEFAYSNSFHASIRMVPFEALNDKRCKTPVCWEEVGVQSFHGHTTISGKTSESQNSSGTFEDCPKPTKDFTNAHRRELEFQVGDKVFLKVSPVKGTLGFGQKGKLTQRYIGHFEIRSKWGGSLQTSFATVTIQSS